MNSSRLLGENQGLCHDFKVDRKPTLAPSGQTAKPATSKPKKQPF
jgi:hypothetical protein